MGIGMQRMIRSPTNDSTPFVMPIVMSAFGMQCPGWVLSQKYDTGVHWNTLLINAAMAQQRVKTQTPSATRLNVWVLKRRQ